MEGIVFWLVPVVLLIVLILLTLQIIKHNQKNRLYVVEPLGLLSKNWQVARLEPDNQTLARLFKVLATINLSTGTLLEQIIVSAAGSVKLKSKPTLATMVEHQAIGPLAEQFVLAMGGKNQSIMIGPLEQIEKFVDGEKIVKYRALSQKSADNGYLALTIATSFVHGDKLPKIKHQIEGLVILEPEIDGGNLTQLQTISQAPIRFLTVLPLGVATHLYGQIFPDKAYFGLNAKELETLLPPKFAEIDLEKAVIVGGADLIARHQTLRVWQRRFDCVVVSRNPEDRDLPLTPVSYLS